MPPTAYLGLGALLFCVTALAEYAAFAWLGGSRGAQPDSAKLKRWVVFVVVFEGLVVAMSALYVARFGRAGEWTWIAPPVGGVFGTAVGLQFALVGLMRSLRG